jgi:hypothetical protein
MRVLVVYAYHEAPGVYRYIENLRYFVEFGIKPYLSQTSRREDMYTDILLDDEKDFVVDKGVENCVGFECDYIIAVNGRHCSVEIPDGVKVIKRDNKGFDFGAYTDGLNSVTCKYDYYMFLNAGQRGPFLPSYWPKKMHWSLAFIEFFKDNPNAGIVGSSMIVRHPFPSPVVETWAFMMSLNALEYVRGCSNVFSQHASKWDAVVQGEDQLSVVLRKGGYEAYCLLYKYKRMKYEEYRDRMMCNGWVVSRPKCYEGINIAPLETIFYKTYWRSTGNAKDDYYECPVEQRYTQWDFREPENSRSILDLDPSGVSFGFDGVSLKDEMGMISDRIEDRYNDNDSDGLKSLNKEGLSETEGYKVAVIVESVVLGLIVIGLLVKTLRKKK